MHSLDTLNGLMPHNAVLIFNITKILLIWIEMMIKFTTSDEQRCLVNNVTFFYRMKNPQNVFCTLPQGEIFVLPNYVLIHPMTRCIFPSEK